MSAALAGGRRPAETLILSGGEVARLMRPADWLAAVETGFRAAAEGKAEAPPPMTLAGAGGAFHAKGASLALGRRYAALKLNGNFPGNPEANGLPTIQGAILLCDGETGSLLAVIDSIEVTLRRTAAATALAARYLARPDSATILICGCGAQGRAQLTALRDILPLRRAYAWDRDEGAGRAFAEEMGESGLIVAPVREMAPADVIVTCTTSRTAFLGASVAKPGAFVAAVGADSPDKSEIEPALMARALIVADVTEQCAAMGDLRHALAAGMARSQVHGELADLVAGRKPGRTRDDQITLFDSTGTALQDVAAAAFIFERAHSLAGVRTVALGRP